MQLTKEQDEYNDEVSDKLKNISDLERRIQQLSLDDSREAQAEREKLLEDLYEKQKDLSKYQAEHSYNATVDSLEKQADAFEEEKDKEKEAIEKSISSYQKKYDLALQYIRNNYSSLYEKLYEWNYEYGSSGSCKTHLTAGIPLELCKLQHKNEISLSVNVLKIA